MMGILWKAISNECVCVMDLFVYSLLLYAQKIIHLETESEYMDVHRIMSSHQLRKEWLE